MSIEDLNSVDWALLGALVVLFIAQVWFYARYMAAPARKMRRNKKSSIVNRPVVNHSGVSVILTAHNEAYNLSQHLQVLLTQDYPEYEVIVVDDGSEDDTRAVIDQYMAHDPRLRMTFVPYGARVRSTKKLALTLAAKAAKYDYLLLSEADCVPESAHWISAMMSGFAAEKNIVLGFSAYFEGEGHVNRIARYESLFNSLQFLGAALCGYPYIGLGRNLAYRKSLFFESGGFTHLMTIKAGDDELFVNQVATRGNTAVVLNRDAFTWSQSKKTMKDWLLQRRRHLSVAPEYKQITKVRLAMEPVTRGLFYIMTIVALVVCRLSIVGLAAIGLFLVRWVLQSAILNVSARRMGLKRFKMGSVLWFDIVLPIISLYMLIVPQRNRNKW